MEACFSQRSDAAESEGFRAINHISSLKLSGRHSNKMVIQNCWNTTALTATSRLKYVGAVAGFIFFMRRSGATQFVTELLLNEDAFALLL